MEKYSHVHRDEARMVFVMFIRKIFKIFPSLGNKVKKTMSYPYCRKRGRDSINKNKFLLYY